MPPPKRVGGQIAAVRRAASGSFEKSVKAASGSSQGEGSKPSLKKGSSKVGSALKSNVHGKHTVELVDIMEDNSTTCLRRSSIKLLMTPLFDYLMGVVILFNMLVMVIEMDRAAAGEESDSEGSWTKICGWAILIIFCLELVLRLFAFRCIFWKDSWNIVDFLIVAVDAGFSFVGLVVGDAFPVSMLRIFRLAKLARISKVLRVFPELRVLLASLVGSTMAIFWGMVLLFFVLLVWSMVAVLFIHPLVSNMDFGDCVQCGDAYSSVMRSMLTLWQQLIANDEWGTVTIDVILQHPLSIVFFMPMFLSISMAIMNLILGVVVNVALSSKDQIDQEDESEKKLLRMERHTHILDLCDEMDVDRKGTLSREQVFTKYEEPGEFRDSINVLDVTEEDLEIVWTIVDHDKKGVAPYKEFVNRLYSIRSSDTEFMLAYIKYYITMIRHDLLSAVQGFQHTVEDDIEKIEEIEETMIEQQKDLIAKTDQIQEKIDGGSWEVLHEDKQELCKAPGSLGLTSPVRQESPESPESTKSSKTKSKASGSIASPGGLSGKAEDGVYDGQAWDKQLHHDMEALQHSLKNILLETSRKLESQVSCVNKKIMSKMRRPEAAVDAKNVLQSEKRFTL